MKTYDKYGGFDLYYLLIASYIYLKGNLKQANFLGSVVIFGSV